MLRVAADAAPLTEAVFVADPADARRAVPCETLTLIYHRPSGTTHVVAPPVPAILDALAQPMTARDLAAQLGFADEEAAALIAERLAELADAGLVRRA